MPALNSIRKSFDRDLKSAELLFSVACVFAEIEKTHNEDPPIRPGQARRIAGLAFLVISKAWEKLVEDCLVRYLTGAKAPSGKAFALKEPPPAHSLEKAYELVSKTNLLKGREGGLYCSDWGKVQACASVLLTDGKPFTDLSDEQRDLLARATKIRNRVAHDSANCRNAFLRVAEQHGETRGFRPRGYTVGHLLLKRTNKGFGKGAKCNRVFCHYASNFKAMADVICPMSDGLTRGATGN